MPDGQMAITLKGNPEHLDDVIQMLQGKPAQEAAGGAPAMPMASAPPPVTAGPALLGRVPMGEPTQAATTEAAGSGPFGVQGSPMGARPGRSLLGKIEHGLGVAGEIAGTAFAPRLMPFIPGTTQHNIMEQDLAEKQKESDAGIGLSGATADYREAQAYKLRHPEQAVSPDQAQATVSSGSHAYEWNPSTQRYDIPIGSQKAGSEAQATATSGGQAYEWNPATSRYDIPIGSEKAGAEKIQPHITTMKDGQPHIMERDPATGQYSIDRGIAPPNFAMTGLYDPVTANVGGTLMPASFNKRTGAVTVAKVQGGATVLPHDASAQVGKSMEQARGADTRYRVMVDNERAALEGNQQAMLNILANHMGMTQGLQKGSRINQAMWDEAMGSAPWMERILSRFTKVDPTTGDRVITQPLKGLTLSPEQIKQMVDLGYDRRTREWQQVEDTGKQYGLDIRNEIPPDVRKSLQGLGTVEARSAVGPQSRGETSGPKAGMVEDGYRFKGGDPSNKANWEKVAR